MPVRASVVALPEPGHAILRVSELDAAPEGLALSIQRQQGPDTHLADDGWRRTEAWLMPDEVTRKGDVLEFHLGPEICDRLAGIATIRLRVKEPDIGVVGTTVVAWPTMLTSGAAGSSGTYDDTVRLRRRQAAAPAEPAPEPLPPPFEPPPEPRRTCARCAIPAASTICSRSPSAPASAVGRSPLIAFVSRAAPPMPPTTTSSSIRRTSWRPRRRLHPAAAPGEPPKKSVRDTVADYLATKPAPTPEAMLAKGRDFLKAGDTASAFLVFRRAAEAGNTAAQLELATFYDPLTQPARGGFTPEGVRAADWYERAALAGVAEAQRKLGLLLAKGGAGLAAEPPRPRPGCNRRRRRTTPTPRRRWTPCPSEIFRFAAADGGPRRPGARPDRECIDLRRPEGGEPEDGRDLALDDLRTLGEDHGNRRPAQRSALRMHRRRRSWSWSSPPRRDIRSSPPISPTAPTSAMAASRSTAAAAASSFPSRRRHASPPPYRAAFDYHCRLDMPADPIQPATRADCLF